MNEVFTKALEYSQKGLSVIPANIQTKIPALNKWKPYQSKIASESEITSWFSKNENGLGVIGGKVSGNLEMFDFDNKAELLMAFAQKLDEECPGLLPRFAWEDTQSGGSHFAYRCNEIIIPGNQELAKKGIEVSGPGDHIINGKPYKAKQHGDKWFVVLSLIETRGEGGYFITAPSKGYKQLYETSLDQLPVISAKERQILIDIALSLNQWVDPVIQHSNEKTLTDRKGLPGTDFNERGDVRDILRKHGWMDTGRKGDFNGASVEQWRRPGKKNSSSASLIDGKTFHVFSSNADPFKAWVAYSPFAIYALLEHSGDFKETAKALSKDGYGEDLQDTPETLKTAIHETDLGNAMRFAAQYGDKIRYNWTMGKWLVYDGTRWNPYTGKAKAQRFAFNVVRNILAEANKFADSTERKRVAKWSFTSESSKGIRAMLDLAKALPKIECYSDQFDTDQFLLNINNGTVDLRTGQLQKHNPDDMISKLAPVTWTGEISSFDGNQLWLSCLATWMKNDKDAIDYLQRLGGMCLTGDITSRVFPIFWGPGKNGKNSLLDTQMKLMGDYATIAPRTLLKASYNEEHSTEIAELMGMRLVIASETKKSMKLKTSLVKTMTGDARLKGRFMRQDNFTFDITHKTILMTQNLPIIDETTDAIWDRVHKVKWGVRIPENKQDHQLGNKLKAEWPHILGWLIKGCLQWQKDGYVKPTDAIKQDTLEYRKDMHPLKDFLDENCIEGEGKDEFFIPVTKLKKQFDDWDTNKKKMVSQDFNSYMVESGYTSSSKRVDGKPVKCWFGLRLRENSDA